LEGRRQNPYLLAGLSAVVALALFRLGAEDVLLAVVNAALIVGVFFHLALKAPPAVRLLAAVLVIVAMLFVDHFGWLTVLFAASLFLGLYYYRLARTLQREDDFLYAPLLYGLFFFSVLLLISYMMHRQNPIEAMRGFFETSWREVKQYLQDVGAFSKLSPAERSTEETLLRNRLFYYFTGSALALYQVIVFFLCRFVRRRGAALIGREPAPFAFLRIREQYLFILILAIVVEIIGSYKDEASLLYISRTIFVFTGTTYFLAGLSLVAFLFLWRKKRQGQLGLLIFLPYGALALFLFYPRICAVVGLLDVWFDFRAKLPIPA
jgi:hypothetical protein